MLADCKQRPTTPSQEAWLGIFIRRFENESQFYTINGKWMHRVLRTPTFSVPRFVTPAMVEEILPYLPTKSVNSEQRDKLYALDGNVPRHIGSQIVSRMRLFHDATEAAYRRYSSSLDNAHNLVAHETDITYSSISEIASNILPSIPGKIWSHSTLYAVHKALLRNEFGFLVDTTTFKQAGRLEIRPKEEVRSVDQVRSWLRDFQERVVTKAATQGYQVEIPDVAKPDPISEFVLKARQLIAESREKRVPTKLGNIGPSPNRSKSGHRSGESISTYNVRASVTFSDTDRSIIRFFETWAGYRSFPLHVPLNALASMILRVVGMYEGYELDHATGWVFLQELGVYAPWENRMVLNTKLGLPGHRITLEADQLRLENIRASRSTKDMTDTMQGRRKDWGDLEVFCIDSDDAREIDDGLSLESIPGCESQYWNK